MADTLDVLTLDEAKAAINMTAANDQHEGELELFITAVSRRFDELIGPVVNRTVTEYHDGGVSIIWPYQTPVSTVTSLTEWDGSASTVLTADAFGVAGVTDGYLLESSPSYVHGTRLIRRSGGTNTYFTTGSRSIQLVYVAGRAATTEDVDSRIKAAAGMVLRRAWKREAGAWAQTPTFLTNTEESVGTGFYKVVDPVVHEWLGDELKPPAIA